MHPAKRAREDPPARDTGRTAEPSAPAVDDDSEDDVILVRMRHTRQFSCFFATFSTPIMHTLHPVCMRLHRDTETLGGGAGQLGRAQGRDEEGELMRRTSNRRALIYCFASDEIFQFMGSAIGSRDSI